MRRRPVCHSTLTVLLITVVSLSPLQASPPPESRESSGPRPVDFRLDVLPILESRCLECHGAEEPEGGLHLLSRAGLLRGGDSGEPAVIAASSDKSFLIRILSGQIEDLRMPPDGPRLTPDEIGILRRWIDQGLSMPGYEGGSGQAETTHWSFQPVQRPAVPVIEDAFISTGVDAFVLRKLRENQLHPSPRASRRTLIRRLFLVMHGMPPEPHEVAAFEQDLRPDAWPRLVERVLESPRYGERWAQHWLDLIRFGETHGFETNRERPHAWPFRDWVIDALNRDKPYDVFVREQIAGDALGAPVGTGFLVAGPHDLVKSPDINLTMMQRQDELSDLVNTVGTAFLGLTLGCARCHNHKFDPVSQTDFYSVQAVFAGVQHGDQTLPPTAEQRQRRRETEQQIDRRKLLLTRFVPVAGRSGSQRDAVRADHNVDRFEPVECRFLRFTIEETNTGSQPCLDELEVFAGAVNVALAADVTASSTLPGYSIHRLEHINDGRYGNRHSWISNEPGAGWVQLEFPEVVRIDRVEWARDRERQYRDRLPTRYRIDVAVEASHWRQVADSSDRKPIGDADASSPVYDFSAVEESVARQGQTWLAELKKLQQQLETLSETRKVYAGKFIQPGPTHRLFRGEPAAKREEVSPDVLAVLGSLELDRETPEQLRRVKFAEWVAANDNPLTARVIVNRLWQFHFGTGIVPTSSDFGRNGIPPTHPELLDWLAAELVESGWSLKHLHRLLLLSRTWQMDSRPNEAARRIDGAARLLWRFPPRRLEAEAIRDCILAVSGKLDLTMGGPGFSGFDVEMENVRHFHPKSEYGPEDYRRMIYMTKVRQERESVFGLFDCPDASQVVPVRSRSTTPLQALNLLNSQFIMEQSSAFAERLVRDAGPQVDRQIRRAFLLVFAREPDPDELHDAAALIRATDLTQFCRALLNANEFLFIQ